MDMVTELLVSTSGVDPESLLASVVVQVRTHLDCARLQIESPSPREACFEIAQAMRLLTNLSVADRLLLGDLIPKFSQEGHQLNRELGHKARQLLEETVRLCDNLLISAAEDTFKMAEKLIRALDVSLPSQARSEISLPALNQMKLVVARQLERSKHNHQRFIKARKTSNVEKLRRQEERRSRGGRRGKDWSYEGSE